MVKRFLALIVALAFCLTMPANAALNIIWVSDAHQTIAGATTPDDQGWVDMLRSKGYNVDYRPPTATATGYWRTLDDAKLAALDAADLIIVSRDASSGEHASNATEVTQWNSVKTPLILLQNYLAQSSRWLWLNTTSIGARQNYFTAKAIDPFHAVFAGVALDAQGQVNYMDPAAAPGHVSFMNTTSAGNGKVIAVRPDNNYVLIVEWAPGTPFYSGSSQTPGDRRMLFIGGTQENTASVGWGVYNLTPQGEKMFLNAVAYIPEPATAALMGLGGLALLRRRKK